MSVTKCESVIKTSENKRKEKRRKGKNKDPHSED